MNNYLSTNLKFIRTQRGLTQEQFAKLLNKDYSTIGKWENGTRSPIMEDALKIADILNISVNDLLTTDLRLKDTDSDFNELDKILFSKAKELSDDDKKFIINLMNKINKQIDEEQEK